MTKTKTERLKTKTKTLRLITKTRTVNPKTKIVGLAQTCISK